MKLSIRKITKKKKERKEEKTEQRRRAKKVYKELYMEELLPVVALNDAGVGIMEDGSLCDCFQIITKDLNRISSDELLRDIMTWDKLYKIYSGDLKIVFFSYHAETEEQQRYVEYKLTKTKNPIFKEFLKEKLNELERVHELYLTPGVALFFYGQNETEYKNNYITVYTTLTKASHPLIKKMSRDRKKRLFFQLSNKNLKQ